MARTGVVVKIYVSSVPVVGCRTGPALAGRDSKSAGFDIGIATAWRYVRLFCAVRPADDLDAAMRRIRTLAYAILDGTLIPIGRVADQKPYYSGCERRWCERPGHRRRHRSARVGVTGSTRLDAWPDGSPGLTASLTR